MRLLIGILLVIAVFAFGAHLRTSREKPAPIAAPAIAPAIAPRAEPEKSEPPAPADKPEEKLEPVRRDVRNVTPDRVLPGPEIETALIERLPAVTPPPPPKPTKPESWPRAAVLSAKSVRSRKTNIVFAGIEALDTADRCTAADGTTWRCGNFARAALQRLIRLRTLECDPVADAAQGTGSAEKPISTRCRVAGRDIGEWLVARGWATALPESGYEEAQVAARQAGRGQWRRENPERAQPARALLRPGVPEPVIPDPVVPEAEASTDNQGF